MDLHLCKTDKRHFSLGDRFKQLVGNSTYSDFTFYIEDDNVEIPAHKLIIARASPVMHRIVYGAGNLAPASSSKVDGITEAAFMEILHYIYTDIININDDNVFKILRKANYFGILAIERKCFCYLYEQLNVSTVHWILYGIYEYDSSSKLFQRCLEIIRLQPLSVFATDTFERFNMDAFKLILMSDTINCSEVDLFEATIKLATSHCNRQGILVNRFNLMDVLKGAEKLLRVETFNETEFDYCFNKCADIFLPCKIASYFRPVDSGVKRNVSKRKRHTFSDADWLEVRYLEARPRLNPSWFYSGHNLFICRYKVNNVILPHEFALLSMKPILFSPHPKERELHVEALCGSGYEWRKSNGTIPIGAVIVSNENERPIFIGRAELECRIVIGAVYNGSKMLVYTNTYINPDNFEMHYQKQGGNSTVEIAEFEILVAINVKKPFTESGIPSDAVCVGVNEQNLKTYLSRGWYGQYLLPASVTSEHNISVSSFSSRAVTIRKYQFLRMDPGTYKWKAARRGELPLHAIEGGCTLTGETLYFGRVFYKGIYIAGRVHLSHEVLYIPYQDKEMSFECYEVLVKVTTNQLQ